MICLLSWRAFNTIVIWILGFVGKLGLGTKCTETIGNNGRFQEVEEFNSKNVQTWACCATCTCRLQKMTQAFTNAFRFRVYFYLWNIGFLCFCSWVFLHLCIFVLMSLCIMRGVPRARVACKCWHMLLLVQQTQLHRILHVGLLATKILRHFLKYLEIECL